MDILSEEHWRDFRLNGKWNGKMFEELIGLLLKEYSDREWHQTKASWDGSKDFVMHSDCFTAWAECKMFGSPLPLKGVAPTLVMAQINGADLVIFFSFSELTATAIQAAAHFAWRAGLQFRIYDNKGLEALILHSSLAKDRYFPTVKSIEFPAAEPALYSRVWVDVDEIYARAMEDMMAAPPPIGAIPVSRGQLLRLDVTVHNMFPFSGGEFSLEIGKFTEEQFRWVAVAEGETVHSPVPQRLTVSLAAGEVRGYSLYFRILKARNGGEHEFPRILVQKKGNKKKACSPEKFTLSSALYTPLIGRVATEFVTRCRQWSSARRTPLFIAVHGSSGAGKSRIVRELREPLLANGYRTTFMDGAVDGRGIGTSPLRMFLPVLVRKVLRLPPIPEKSDLRFVRELSNPLTLERSEQAFGPDELEFLLTPPPNLDDDALAATALPLLVNALRSQVNSLALLIDNVQDYDESVAGFLSRLAELLQTNGPRIVLAFVFNTQTWNRRSETERLLRRWQNAEKQRSERFLTLELVDFDQRTFADFVGALLTNGMNPHAFVETHEVLWRALWEKIEAKPLHIEQALLYAKDSQVVEMDVETGFLRVLDEAAFVKLVGDNFISSDFVSLMRLRWLAILKDWHRKGARKRPLAFKLLCFCGRLDIQDAHDFGISDGDIEDFVSRGLARRSGTGVEPYHRQTQRVFHEAIFRFSEIVRKRNRIVAQCFLKGMNRVWERPYLSLQRFVAEVLIGRCGPVRVADALRRNWLIAVEPQERTFLYMARHLALEPDVSAFSSRRDRINLLLRACEGLRHILPRQQGHSLFTEADTFVMGLVGADECDTDVAHFHAAYGNQMLVGHNDERLLEVLKEAESKVDTTTSTPHFRSYLADRLCVAHKSLGQYKEARRAGSQALRLARAMPSDDNWRREREVFALIDIANIYQNGCDLAESNDICVHGKSRIYLARHYWAEADKVFRKIPAAAWPTADFMPMLLLYRAQNSLLDGDLTGCRKITARALGHCREKNVAFFGVKLHIITSISYLLDGDIALKEAVGEASQALNWAVCAGVDRYLWTCYWLKGVLLLREGKYDEARDAYRNAAEQLDRATDEDAVKMYHYHFYDDLILQSRRFQWFGTEILIEFEIPSRLRERYGTVLTADDGEFDSILKHYQPTARFTDGCFNLPSP